MRTATIGIILSACALAACSDARPAADETRDATSRPRVLSPGAEAAPVAVSALEGGQPPQVASKAPKHAEHHVAVTPPTPEPKPGDVPVASEPVVSAPVAPEPQATAPAPEATAQPAQPAPAGPSAPHNGDDDAVGEDVQRAGRRGGVIIIRGGGSGLDPCDLDGPMIGTERPRGPAVIDTRVPNMGGPLASPAGATGTNPGTGTSMPGMGGVITRGLGGTIGGGGIRGGTRGGMGGMHGGGRIHR